MKRWITMLCIMLGLWSFASAEVTMDAEVEKVLLASYPGYEIIAGDQWGTAAAAALAKGDERILCVVEKYNDLWRIVIDNPHALHKGEKPSILMDSDISLFWSYGDGRHYSCYKGNGLWGTVQCMQAESTGDILWETEHRWTDGVLQRQVWKRDTNENLISTQSYCPVPAAWLKGYVHLTNFDCSVFPLPGSMETGGWLTKDALARCAREIYPGATFVHGAAEEDGLELLMEQSDGTRILVTHAYPGGQPVTCVSSPLPEGTGYGCENFTTVLALPSGLMADVAHNGDGTWRVNYVWPYTAEGEPVFMGRNWVSEEQANVVQRCIGDHAWSDISAVDWALLPHNLEEAAAALNTERWAVVNNPDPADRLHLREREDKGSRSLGKYYNGTPVEVLKRGDTWTKVRVANSAVGWMMTKYLAFGEDMQSVRAAFPDLQFIETETIFYVRQRPEMSAVGKGEVWAAERGEETEIIGIVGDEWYHVWFPDTNQGGYMRQSDFWPGNG